MMNEELYTKCSEWEKVFNNALKLNFLRISMDEWNKIALIYEQHFNKKIRPNERGCNNCRLRIVKELGTAYLNEKKEIEEKAKKEQEEQGEPKKKVGRPRKINLDETE